MAHLAVLGNGMNDSSFSILSNAKRWMTSSHPSMCFSSLNLDLGPWNLVQGVKRLVSSGKLFLMAREVGLGLSLLLASFSARSFLLF